VVDEQNEEIAHLEQIAATLRRRLQVLEAQAALYGALAVPAHILLEREDTERQLAQALAELRRVHPGLVAAAAPYCGLLTFQEADADRFFGRDVLVADLLERVRRSPFLAVLGPSGSGKSSVVRAGLLPLLKGGALPESDRCTSARFRSAFCGSGRIIRIQLPSAATSTRSISRH
jgi:Novel STAND NTPase 1